MKILHLIQKKQLRGAEQFACQLSIHLQAKGHQVKMVSLENGNAVLPYKDVEILHASPGKLLDWKAWKSLANLIHTWKPDIVQANAGDTLRYSIVSQFLFRWKIPVVFRNASMMSRYIRNPVVKWIYARLLKRVGGIASVSEASKSDLMQLYPNLKIPFRVIPIGIEPDQLENITSIAPIDGPFLLHVGGFTFEKNHPGLLRICELIWKSHPEIKLVLAGDGPLMEDIKQQVAQTGAQARVHFLGTVTHIGPLMKRASLLMLPSIIEGLPGVVLEAMYCRIPVIAYEVGGINEVITSGKTGWLIAPGDEAGFANKVLEVLQNSHLTDSVKDQAFHMVSEHFENTQIAERFFQFYTEVITIPSTH